MAHFAEIDEQTGVVQRVLVVPDKHEHRGEAFLRDDLGLGGSWVQTSYNATIRRRFAAVGMSYDAGRDAFVLPRPWPSWTLDAAGDWQPPVPMPEGHGWSWSEDAGAWVLDVNAADKAELQRLDEVGPERAQAIIDGRPWSSLTDLTQIDGISAATVENWGEQATVGP